MKKFPILLITGACYFQPGMLQAQTKNQEILPTLQVIGARADTNAKSGKLEITIDFNIEVDKSTVKWGETLFLWAIQEDNIHVDIRWSINAKTITIITRKPFSSYREANGYYSLRLTLKGSAKSSTEGGQVKTPPWGIKSKNGQFLDGNGDFKSGGDYVLPIQFIW